MDLRTSIAEISNRWSTQTMLFVFQREEKERKKWNFSLTIVCVDNRLLTLFLFYFVYSPFVPISFPHKYSDAFLPIVKVYMSHSLSLLVIHYFVQRKKKLVKLINRYSIIICITSGMKRKGFRIIIRMRWWLIHNWMND